MHKDIERCSYCERYFIYNRVTMEIKIPVFHRMYCPTCRQHIDKTNLGTTVHEDIKRAGVIKYGWIIDFLFNNEGINL